MDTLVLNDPNHIKVLRLLKRPGITGSTVFSGYTGPSAARYKYSARVDLFLIQAAWRLGCDFEDLADGYGEGMGTMGGDWSGIRDSSDEAVAAMFAKAKAFLQ